MIITSRTLWHMVYANGRCLSLCPRFVSKTGVHAVLCLHSACNHDTEFQHWICGMSVLCINGSDHVGSADRCNSDDPLSNLP